MPVWMRLTLLALLVSLAVVMISCDGGASSSDSTPGPATQTPETPPTVVLTPSAKTKGYLGPTIAFDYPDNWYLLRQSYEAGEERVVLANIDRNVSDEDLPDGAIRIEFSGFTGGSLGSIPGDVKETVEFGGIRFSLREGQDVPWRLTGTFLIGGVNFRYIADVRMNTAEPAIDLLRPVLESWVVGSANNHPTRRCISPVECP